MEKSLFDLLAHLGEVHQVMILPQSSKLGTYKTVTARIWLCLSDVTWP